ncbi:NH(3)-dependent NAD(+) synthetase [Tangfeifania diversioriginum]|uniref:Glutamine-dependent NAD(+) synthetase n=1 Tax=Tangfeifania diversioriginum TaxID=1168035 RepID=A0A1M6MCT4_9BACT|nr:NAD+ synthase [Tangfeifania diversioriginum]SHJ81251.1 NH(3)-dependent NAD(+) synthetase [Tangfeifania diversioriginum]
MKVTLAQLNYIIGDFEGNAVKIIETIEKAKNAGADLVVFSELSVTGYYPHDLLEKKEFIRKAEERVKQIAASCNNIAAIVGAPRINENEEGKTLYNAAFFLTDGKIRSVHNKTLLPTYDIFDEYRHFEPNQEFNVVEYKGEKIAVTICEDLWDEQPTANEFGKNKLYRVSPMEELAKLRPDFVVNISASPFSYNQESWRKDVLVSKAKRFNTPIFYVNQIGAQTELIFDGGSVFINEQGEIVKELKYFEEDFLIVDTQELGEPEVQPKADHIEKIHDALVLGLRDYFRKMGFKQATLGLSGGIDSAVTAVLAVEALGPENVRVLLMPSKYSSGHSVDDARQLAENLGIQYDIIKIQNAVDEFEKELAPLFEGTNPDVTEENIQARARGVFVMAVSNKFGHILLNTTNKSECAVGYGTLYGDMNGGLAVLGDVYKTDVFQMARFMNAHGEIIPENTITKPPSAELRPDQKDTDSLPDYSVLDEILFSFIELNQSPQEIIAKGFDEKEVNRVIRMVNINEYKRFQAAPILRVSSKAFGFGRKMPLVARY